MEIPKITPIFKYFLILLCQFTFFHYNCVPLQAKFLEIKRFMAQEDVFKKIVSHCKEYGFVFPSSEIYDGLGAVYDYGQNGVELKKPRLEEALSC